MPEGFYSTLAGFVEVGESIEQAVHREVFEEVGIKVKNLKYFDGSYTDFVSDSTGARFTYGSPPPTVPDGGSSLLLLGLAGAGLRGFQRKFS